MRTDYFISELCDALGVSRSGYHAWRTRTPGPRHRADARLLEHMDSIHKHRHTRCYGSPRMTYELRRRELPCSENRVARLMRCNAMRARPRKPYRPRTTRTDHAAHPSPNLLAQADSPAGPGTQVVSDITYIPTREGWVYLAVVLDLYSRSILGWALSDSLHSEVVLRALTRTIDRGILRPNAIFHSDRGCQYTASSTRQMLARHGLKQSMSAKGYCYDNAYAESVFASLKSELIPESQPFASRSAASSAVFDYIETFYNRRRLHSSLGYCSPSDFLDIYFQNLTPSAN